MSGFVCCAGLGDWFGWMDGWMDGWAIWDGRLEGSDGFGGGGRVGGGGRGGLRGWMGYGWFVARRKVCCQR